MITLKGKTILVADTNVHDMPSAEEIADSIKFYINNKTKLLQIGESGFLWYKKNIVSYIMIYIVIIFS